MTKPVQPIESGFQAGAGISIDAGTLGASEMYVFLRDSVIPRPIAWVSTVNAAGKTNLAPFSFFNVVSPHPPIVGFSCGPRGDNFDQELAEEKDTLMNIRAGREFVVNIVPERLIDEMARSSDPLAHGESEFDHTGLVEAPSTAVRPPRVQGVPVALECRLYDILDVGVNVWIMGTVVHMHVDPACYLGAQGKHQHRVNLLARTEQRPVGRLDRANFGRLREVEVHLRKFGPK
jgi:flavin reductase (DIM6/NTAB) family NADH-FMN oxidoreductase RutF